MDCAANIDVGKIEGLAVEGYKTLRADLPDIVPEVREHFTLVWLAVGARSVQFDPMNADTDDPACAGVKSKTVKHLQTVFFGLNIQENLTRTGRNPLWILPYGFNVHDKSCGLPHFFNLRGSA
jgi:hypothetical protein